MNILEAIGLKPTSDKEAEKEKPLELSEEEQNELNELYADYQKPRELRVVCDEYVYTDQPGIVERKTSAEIWGGQDVSFGQFELERDGIEMPATSFEEGEQPRQGDSEYRYRLQEYIQGKWENIRVLEGDVLVPEEDVEEVGEVPKAVQG